jgi:hypothetical protein
MFDGLFIGDQHAQDRANILASKRPQLRAEAVEPRAGYGSCNVCSTCPRYQSAGFTCSWCNHRFEDHNP